MTRPLWTVRHVTSEAELPKTLEKGRAYFVSDEQVIIIDMGDGRGPVRYGDKPGPQGMAGEPIPQMQDMINDLALASVTTTNTIKELREKQRSYDDRIISMLADHADMISSSATDSASSILKLITIVSEKFRSYDDAISILAKTVSNLYPDYWGSHAGDGRSSVTTGEIITAAGKCS